MSKPKLRLSHVHWKVDNLKTAVKDLETLGFLVEWGRNPKYSPNAFIWFNDDVFLEICTAHKPANLLALLMGLI